MKLQKRFGFYFMLAVLVFLPSCQTMKYEKVVEANNEEGTSVLYNGVEYIEREYDSTDNFRPFLCSYSLTGYENNLLKKDVYSIDESFIADKRDENLNFIYIPLLLWETVVYERKDFEVPQLKDIHNKIDNILIVYPDINGDNESEKQIIDDPEQISIILNFFESLESAEIIKDSVLPADNKKINVCAVSGYYGGEFDVGPEFVYYSNGSLIAFSDDKQYKAPEEVNDIFENTKRTKYEWK